MGSSIDDGGMGMSTSTQTSSIRQQRPDPAIAEGEALLQKLTQAALRAARADVQPPSPEAEAELRSLMEAVQPEHLGVRQPSSSRCSNSTGAEPRVIRTQIVWHSSDFELCIFLFPDGASIPLHNHPNMTVLSKVLYGRLGVRSYDWVTPPTATEYAALTAELERLESDDAERRAAAPLAPPRAAWPRATAELTRDKPTATLRPNEANVHAFVARGPTAVLDLLLPPYDDDAGRDCHYFVTVDHAQSDEHAQTRDAPVMLRPAAPPDSLVIKGQAYQGPRIQKRGRPREHES